MQLVDELSMIYTTCLMAYASFSYSRPTRVRLILAISLLSLAVFITLYYHYLQDPVFHQNAYALLTTVDAEGHFVSRPMAQQEIEFDGDLWFFAERDSRKVAQLGVDPHVGVSLSSNDTWVSLSGTAVAGLSR